MPGAPSDRFTGRVGEPPQIQSLILPIHTPVETCQPPKCPNSFITNHFSLAYLITPRDILVTVHEPRPAAGALCICIETGY